MEIYIEQLKYKGYTIIPDILSNKEVAYITVHGEYIYIGARAEGLFRISLNEKDGFSQHRMSFEDKDIPFITTLNSQQDMLYIGTLTGLLVADSKNSLFKEVEQLKGQRVTFIHIAGNGTYVSTGDNGVYHFNSDLSQLLYHYNKNNIKGSAIYSVLTDEQGNLLMSTNNGILKIHNNKKIEQFG